VSDHHAAPLEAGSADWFITNPPLSLAKPFTSDPWPSPEKGSQSSPHGFHRNHRSVSKHLSDQSSVSCDSPNVCQKSVRPKRQHGYRLCLARVASRCARWVSSHGVPRCRDVRAKHRLLSSCVVRPDAVTIHGRGHASKFINHQHGLPDPLNFQVRSHAMVAHRSGTNLDRESVKGRLPSSLPRCLLQCDTSQNRSVRRQRRTGCPS
jgi:hypothetical protein